MTPQRLHTWQKRLSSFAALTLCMALVTAGMTFARQGSARAAAGAVCYLVADSFEGEGINEDGISSITWQAGAAGFDPDFEVGEVGLALADGTPLADTEAAAFDPWTGTLYAINAAPAGAGTGAQLGTIDPTTGEFTPIGTGLGAQANQPNPIALGDVDSLTINPFDGSMWATVRRVDASVGAQDALIRIDPATGLLMPTMFSGNDYVLLNLAGGTTTDGFMDVDDLAFSPTSGLLYGVANDEGNVGAGANSNLVLIDPATGTMSPAINLGSEDVEGLSFHNDGTLWATVGTRITAPLGISELIQVDLTNASATTVGPLGGGNTATSSLFSDIEAISCLTGAPNTITGTLFDDPNGSGGIFDPANGDIASTAGLVVELYRDLNGDGILDASDIPLDSTTTDANGDYSFSVAANGAFIVVLTGTLPGTATTPITQSVDFGDQVGQTDPNNDFGYTTGGYDLALTIAPTAGQPGTVAPGATVAYDIVVTNQGALDATTFDVTVTYPGSGWTLSAAAIAAGWVDNGNGSATRTITPGTPLSTTDTWNGTVELVAPGTIADSTYLTTAEISTDDGDDTDSTPDTDATNDGTVVDDEINGGGVAANEDEDDHDTAAIVIQNPVATADQIDLALSKSLAAGQSPTVAPNSTVTYTLTVTNDGVDAASSFEITDTFPTGWTLAATGNTGWVDNGDGTATYTANPSPALAGNGGTWTVDISLVASQTTGVLNNTAEITEDGGTGTDDSDSTPGNNNPAEDDQDVAGVSVAAPLTYDLALTTTLALGQNSSVNPGDTVTFDVTVINQGTTPVSTFTITDVLPQGFTLTAAAVADGWVDNGDGSATRTVTLVTPLGQGDMAVLDLETQVPASATPGTYTNGAEISADDSGAGVNDADSTPDADLGNDGTVTNDEINGANGDEDDHDTEPVTVLDQAVVTYDLALTTMLATGQATTVNPGDTVTFTVNVTNQGNTPVSTFTVTDVLPQGFTLTAAAIADGWVDNGDGTATRTVTLVTPLTPGNMWMGELETQVPAGAAAGTYTNGAEISADDGDDTDSTPDADLTNDGAVTDDEINGANGDEDDHDTEEVVVEIPVTTTYDLALTTTLATGQATTVNPGDTVTFTVNVINQGNTPVSTFTITDVLPQGFTLTAAAIADGWVDNGDGTATRTVTLVTPLTPGNMWMGELETQVPAGTTPGTYTNGAEISADDGDDADSIPDANLGNDGTVTNDEINGANGDEDDHDIEDVVVEAAQTTGVSIGNTVFEDANQNGTQDNGEAGIAGVTVQLWMDTTGDGVHDTLVETTTTDASGNYSFDESTPGDYVVAIPAAMFATGAPLEGWTNSPGAGDIATDGDDDGIDPANPGEIVLTELFTADANTGDQLGVDFGFSQPAAAGTFTLGNRVFEDTNGNGVRDGSEPALANVPVELWQDTTGDGVVDTRINTTVTDGSGLYSFGNLPEGEYVVVIPASAFATGGVLAAFASSPGVGDVDTNNDDDGIDPITAGGLVRTGFITLDANSGDRFEVDFGFVPTNVGGNNQGTQSIGNAIFNDANDNGVRDAGEVGIAGVTVQLFEDTDGDGIGDTLVETTTTDANGNYSFDLLPNGSYVVIVPSAQFAAGGGLDGFVSSQGVGQLTIDGDDDGIDPAQAGGDVLTGVIVLTDATNGTTRVDFGFVAGDNGGGGTGPDVDLEISKTLLGEMQTNSTVMWSIIVTNNGPDDETTAITMTDVLPFGLTAITAAGNGWECDITAANTTVTCNRFDGLTAGSATPGIIIETSVDAAVGTEIFNQARVDSENIETITNNNRAQDGGTVVKGGHIAFTGAYSTTLAILALSMISMGLAWSMMRRREDLELGFAA